MPICFKKTYKNGTRLAVWEITESYDELIAKSATKTLQMLDFEEIKFKKKAVEFLVSQLLVSEFTALEGIEHSGIYKDEYGKPHLRDSEWQFSLTHTQHFVAVAFHPFLPVGIDLEKPSEKMRKIMSRLFTPEEEKMVGDDIVKMSWFWSAKEALYKLYGKRKVDFKQHLKLQLYDNQFIGEIHIEEHNSKYSLYIESIGDYFLVVAV